jgi:hypothetical protein
MFYPKPDCVRSPANFLSPHGKCLLFTERLKKLVVPFIVCLLGTRCPSTVLRAVVAVTVVALNGATCRTLPHMAQKVLEPFFAMPNVFNANTAPTVIRVRFLVLVVATIVHGPPNVK